MAFIEKTGILNPIVDLSNYLKKQYLNEEETAAYLKAAFIRLFWVMLILGIAFGSGITVLIFLIFRMLLVI